MAESEAQLEQKLSDRLTELGYEPVQRAIQEMLTPENVCLDC